MRPARGEQGKSGLEVSCMENICTGAGDTALSLERGLDIYRITGPMQRPLLSPGTLLWGTQGCESMFRNTSTFSKVVTLFSGGYSKQTFETTVLFSSV